MNIPGDNVLAMALGLIASQKIYYYEWESRESNNVGLWVSKFRPFRKTYASVQAVPRTMYDKLGLDFNKSYVMIYTVKPLSDLDRDRAGDQIALNTKDGKRYEVVSSDDWNAIDGWNGLLCIKVGNPDA